jgi:hypothetical protein
MVKLLLTMTWVQVDVLRQCMQGSAGTNSGKLLVRACVTCLLNLSLKCMLVAYTGIPHAACSVLRMFCCQAKHGNGIKTHPGMLSMRCEKTPGFVLAPKRPLQDNQAFQN